MVNADIGYRVTGVYLDMYVSRSILGSPSSIRVLWATDNQSNNLDSAPDCDRNESVTLGEQVPRPTATPTPEPTLVGGFAAGRVSQAGAASQSLAQERAAADGWPLLLAVLFGAAALAGSAFLSRR